MSAGSQYLYTLVGFANPRTFTMTSNFAVSTFSSTYAVSATTATGIQNTQSNTMVSLSMSVVNPSQSFFNSAQSLRFAVTTFNYLANTDYILLNFPVGYSFTGTPGVNICSSPGTWTCLPDTLNPLTVKMTATTFGNSNAFVFNLAQYTSPSTTSNSFFQINTYQTDGTPIDSIDDSLPATQVKFSLSCNLPCQTC